MGGWRGPVTHLDGGAALAKNWAGPLSQVARPPGMLPDWQLAVVTGRVRYARRKLGWLDPAGQAAGQPPQQHTGALSLSDLAWARPVQGRQAGRAAAADRRRDAARRRGDGRAGRRRARLSRRSRRRRRPEAAAKPPPAAAQRLALRQIPLVQGALVSLDPTTGRVLAMVGGWSFEGSQFNRATQAQRQPGSSFKPFVYLTALEKGISPSQRFLDAPVVMDMGAAGRWRPNNYEMEFGGPTPLRVALERSLNLVTLRVAQNVGMEAVAETAIAFHEVDAMPRVLPAALGAVETTVLREAGAYASLDDGRTRGGPDADRQRAGSATATWCGGRPALDCTRLRRPRPARRSLSDQRKQIADPASVFQLVTMMQGVMQRGTGVAGGGGARAARSPARPARRRTSPTPGSPASRPTW